MEYECIVILISGQTKAGKSSVINEILGSTVVTVAQTPCTSRLVKLKYGDVNNPVVKVIGDKGRVLSRDVMPKMSISSDIINLPYERRGKKEEVNATVVVQVTSGKQFLDSLQNIANAAVTQSKIEILLLID